MGRSCHPLSVLSCGVVPAISIASPSLWSWALLMILAVKGIVGTGESLCVVP